MKSLFDIAAGLSQYNDDDKATTAKLQGVHSQSALGILDETFETIHGARQYRSASRHLPLLRSASMVQLHPSRLSESKTSEALDARLNRLASFKSTLKSQEAAPRRMAPAITAASLIIPPPPAVPPPANNSRKQSYVEKDPDVTAKTILREVTNEVDQIIAANNNCAEDDQSLLRMLSDKCAGQLQKLPGTPFVQLVRKKVAQKLKLLENHICSRKDLVKPPAVDGVKRSSDDSNNNNNNKYKSNNSPTASCLDGVSTPKSFQKLSPAQHKILQNLLRLPAKQLLKLPPAQLELVQFAKRYDKLVKATPDQLQHLPIEHQQLVRSMQQQENWLAHTDERR
ncbi:unnamed protein product [Phytophthora lilii]|uniref:Unnamed protein product n=1 Tax=Phytophthora lilii TaxID=2077276 RepID=A0A9W6WRR1_9STRA|nr:unnamed protein product [Phytophthora lilii]